MLSIKSVCIVTYLHPYPNRTASVHYQLEMITQ